MFVEVKWFLDYPLVGEEAFPRDESIRQQCLGGGKCDQIALRGWGISLP